MLVIYMHDISINKGEIKMTNTNKLPLAILNTTIITADGDFSLKTISLDQAKDLVKNAPSIDSAVGHQSTADILTTLLETKIEMNRQMFIQQPGQKALVFKLKGRPEEGKILTIEEIESIGYEFKALEMKA